MDLFIYIISRPYFLLRWILTIHFFRNIVFDTLPKFNFSSSSKYNKKYGHLAIRQATRRATLPIFFFRNLPYDIWKKTWFNRICYKQYFGYFINNDVFTIDTFLQWLLYLKITKIIYFIMYRYNFLILCILCKR